MFAVNFSVVSIYCVARWLRRWSFLYSARITR